MKPKVILYYAVIIGCNDIGCDILRNNLTKLVFDLYVRISKIKKTDQVATIYQVISIFP